MNEMINKTKKKRREYLRRDFSPCPFYMRKEKRVKTDHPLIGKHVILGAMRPNHREEIEDHVSHLLQTPSCGGDPDFWRIIQRGKIPYTKTPGFVAIRKLKPGDKVSLIDEKLLDLAQEGLEVINE